MVLITGTPAALAVRCPPIESIVMTLTTDARSNRPVDRFDTSRARSMVTSGVRTHTPSYFGSVLTAGTAEEPGRATCVTVTPEAEDLVESRYEKAHLCSYSENMVM
jgi:hypothetical protein